MVSLVHPERYQLQGYEIGQSTTMSLNNSQRQSSRSTTNSPVRMSSDGRHSRISRLTRLRTGGSRSPGRRARSRRARTGARARARTRTGTGRTSRRGSNRSAGRGSGAGRSSSDAHLLVSAVGDCCDIDRRGKCRSHAARVI